MSVPHHDDSTFDFHLHTECSDGHVPPADLFAAAQRAGHTGISITDHDTLDAYDRLGDLPAGKPPWILPGIEFSTRMGDDELHILGYFPKGISQPLVDFVESVLKRRLQRAHDGIASLRERGVDISLEDCQAAARGRVITRTHIAGTLLNKGTVTSLQQAYNHLLGREVFPLPDLSSEEAVEAIVDVGGLAVWAHPFREHLERCLKPLADVGLMGMEVLTPWRRSGEVRTMLDLAALHGLMVTAGSDWHGAPSGPSFGTFAGRARQIRPFLEAVYEAGYDDGATISTSSTRS